MQVGLATFGYRSNLGLRPRLSVGYWLNLIVSTSVLLVLKAAYIMRRKHGVKYGN